MPKRTRELAQLEDPPSASKHHPTLTSSVPPLSPSQEEEARKRQRILDHISLHTAVDPADQLRSDQLAFVPRSYQLELAQLAQAGNVLVCLDTGSGKTLISVLLLQHVHQQQSIRRPPSPPQSPPQPRKVSFFLVNLVPLVHQQSSVIAGNSKLSVGKLYGELKDTVRGKRNKLTVDSWREPQWSALLQSHQVVVSTAQCFLDALIHGFIKMADLNLLIFDEVHHALKNHPFFRIMKYYRLAPEQQRPKIFGMTASPIFTSTGQFDDAARYLQSTMDARIHTVSKQTLQDLREVKQKPEEIVIEYNAYHTVLDDDSVGVPMSELSQAMIAMFGKDPALDDDAVLDVATDHFEKEVRPKLDYTMRHLGPLGCDLLWHSTLLEYRSRARKWVNIDRNKRTLVNDDWIVDASLQRAMITPSETQESTEVSATDGDSPAASPSTGSNLGLGLAVAHLSTNSELNQRILLHMRSQPALPDVLTFHAQNASHKVLRLIETLKCFEPSAKDFCAIIFVERRQTASLLVELIKRVPELAFIHPEFLLGHENGSANGGALGMDWHDQVQVLNRFRRRKPTNLLVATSIAEEGLDIQAANVVIRFDLFNRHISFLQSRGRARAKGSRFILMAETGNRDHAQAILNAFNTEANRAKWLDDIADTDPDAGFCEEEWQQKLCVEADEAAGVEECIYEPSTGARLFPENAPALISHYAATLHSEYLKDAVLAYRLESIDNGPSVGNTFSCVLQLPSNAAVRSVESGECRTKKQAKRMAAFKACQQLRKLGDLDEWLMPKLIDKAMLDGGGVGSGKINPHHKAWRGSGLPVKVPVKKMDGWARFGAAIGAADPAQGDGNAYQGTYLALDAFDAASQPLLLLTRGALPETKLLKLVHSAVGRTKDVRPKSLGPLPAFSKDELEPAKQFTRFVFNFISREDGQGKNDGARKQARKEHGEPAVLVVPVRKARSDGEVTSAADLQLDLPSSLALTDIDLGQDGAVESLQNRVLVRQHGYHSHSLYKFDAIRRDLSPNSPIPSGPSTTTAAVDQSPTYLSQHLKMYGRFHAAMRSIPPEDLLDTLSHELAVSPLFEVRKLAKLSNLLSPASAHITRSSRCTRRLIVPYFYKLHPLSFELLSSISLLPSILTRYDQLLLAHFCNVDIFSSRLDTDLVLEALTSASAGSEFDYERFEFLGDTFLKLVATCHTFTTELGRTEAELHLANKAILTNVRLMKEAQRLGLERYGIFGSGGLVVKRFVAPVVGEVGGAFVRPAVEVGEEETGESDTIKEKTLSDLVEALIGCALASGGPQLALFVCRTLHLLPDTILTLSHFNVLLQDLKQRSIDEGWQARISLSGLTHLETLFSHTYRYPHLALEAFTHPSLLASVLPSYQRLEFLGDAWLDFHIVRKIFVAHPELSPGELTALKGLLASNAALSAMGVKLGLHKYIASDSGVLCDTIATYVSALEKLDAGDAGASNGQYWTHLPAGTVVPKAIADVVEASFASIVVDSGFDESTTQQVFDRIWTPFYDEFCPYDSVKLVEVKRMVGYACGVMRRAVVSATAAIRMVEIRSNLHEIALVDDMLEDSGPAKEQEEAAQEKVVQALLSEVRVELWVGDQVVGRLEALPRSLGHLQRAQRIMREIEATRQCLAGMLYTGNDGEQKEEEEEEADESAGEPSAEQESDAGEPAIATATVLASPNDDDDTEKATAKLDEYHHLFHQLARTLGWKTVFQSLAPCSSTSNARYGGSGSGSSGEAGAAPQQLEQDMQRLAVVAAASGATVPNETLSLAQLRALILPPPDAAAAVPTSR